MDGIWYKKKIKNKIKKNNTSNKKQPTEIHNQDPKSTLFQLNAGYIAEKNRRGADCGDIVAATEKPRSRGYWLLNICSPYDAF